MSSSIDGLRMLFPQDGQEDSTGPGASSGSKLEGAVDRLSSGIRDLAGRARGAVVDGIAKLHPTDPALLAAADPASLAQMSPDAKADLVKKLLAPLHGADAEQAVLQVFQSETADAARFDRIVSRVGSFALEGGLHDGMQSQFEQLRDAVRAQGVTPGDWNGFNAYMDTVTGTTVSDGNKVTFYDNGSQAYPAFYQAIDSAQSTIDVDMHSFAYDATGKEMAQHLIDAAKRGVTVNVIMGTLTSELGLIAPSLRAAGVNVKMEKETNPLLENLDHRKLILVDGKTGFIGGMNIGDRYSTQWHDMHSKVEGPAVADMENAFVAKFNTEGGTLKGDVMARFPPLSPQGNESIRIVPHEHGQDENLRMTYLRAIDTAQSSIRIADPFFCDDEIIDHLAAAAKRGVDVELVWPGPTASPTKLAAHDKFPELLAAGAKLYEYQPSMAHEKVCTVDDQFVTIGSSNLDARSLEYNSEINLVGIDPALAQTIRGTIDEDIANRCKEITAPDTGVRAVVDAIAGDVSPHL